ncbi:hypothetical protein JCM3775_000552 [Rhodotorula graminis]
MALPHHRRTPSAPPSAPSRRPVAVATAAVALLCLLSLLLTAPRHAPTSPSAQRVTSLLSLTSLSSPLDRDRYDDPASTAALSYRRQLERATSQHYLNASRHWFDHVYVLSLPSRDDRRQDMRRLADALGIQVEFVDAADKHEPFIQWIAEWVVESRALRRKEMAKARGVPASRIGGLSIRSDWLTPFPGNVSSPVAAERGRFPDFPKQSWDGGSASPQTWVEHLEALHSDGGRHTSLRPADADLNVTAALWDPREKLAVRQVHEGVLSTYWGQTRAIKRMLDNGDRRALVLEDDVDVEWDVQSLWESIARKLPRDTEGDDAWDVAYLGHCWGGEYQEPMYLHPLLHPSTAPMCLHGYALSRPGAKHLLSSMLDPWRAFSAAVDAVVPALLHAQRALPRSAPEHPLVRSYSIVPPLVVQRKDGPSDLQRGTGSPWRGVLRDSTVERIRRDEGVWHDGWEDRYDEREGRADPATVLRCGQG